MPSRLKSLELHGYKTFAHRTLFEFDDAVTAIVGPNGSGKSNIADSLRWVLGEQSYRLLRARRTEDMIFSGSESRPRAGMASATITFDNSDGWLPIDFSEVAITRRAYRDGQNAYLINGQRVRLLDVSELLSASGLAERTYTVIGQGLVDAALSLKADERRRLFEEAAGIGLYRSRREDAMRRLETTRRNLERVEDILAELQPRLRSLERQARRAQQYEQVRADMRVLLREWYGYHWHSTQRDLAGAREIAHAQEVKLEEARREQVTHDRKLSAMRKHAQELRNDLNSWHRDLGELHTRRETLGRELAVAEERERSLESQSQNAQLELMNWEAEIDFHEEQVASLEQELGRLRGELDESRSQAVVANQALVERQEERARAETDLQTVRQALSALKDQQGQLHARLSERQSRLESTEELLKAVAQKLAAAEDSLRSAQADLEAAQRDEDEAGRALETAEKALLAQRQRIDSAEIARGEVLEERSQLTAELARAKAQLDVLEGAETALTGYASGTRILLTSSRQGKLDGVGGALSKFLEVPAELEKAVAAALGEYLDAVLIESDLERALDLLHHEAGRGVILPLERIVPQEPLLVGTGSDPGFLGLAADLVQAPGELRSVMELLLGRVLIVRDRIAAQRVLAGQPQGVCAVTLAGEVFHASGPIRVSGGGDQSGEGTLLSRSRQRREVTDRLASLEARLVELDGRIDLAEADLKALLAEGQSLGSVQEGARQEYEALRRATDQVRLALRSAERQVGWEQEQRQRLAGEIAQGEDEIEYLSMQLAELEQGLAQAHESLRQKGALLEGLSVEEFQSQVAHWETLAAVAEHALGDAQARRQERQQALEKAQLARTSLEERLEELGASLEALRAKQASQRHSEAQVDGQIKELQALIEPAEAELKTVEGEQADLHKAEAAARQSVSRAEHIHAQTRIALARRQEALQSLRRRIEDDFGLVAFEYDEEISGPTPLPLEGMVEQLPMVSNISPEIEETIKRQRAQLRRMGAINPESQAEYREVKRRFGFLTEQVADLRQAEDDVRQVIAELDVLMEREFRQTYEAVAAEFREVFTRLFGGGSARLVLTEPDNLTATGIDIEARLPGRRTQGLALLSGGERSLTATALIFALIRVSPTPFCVLDEVDAMLDEVNVGRFRELLLELSQNTQFVIVTHNRSTVQVADVIYGVTMGRDSVSKVLSLKMDQVSQVVQ